MFAKLSAKKVSMIACQALEKKNQEQKKRE